MKIELLQYDPNDAEIVKLREAIIDCHFRFNFEALQCPRCGANISFQHAESDFKPGAAYRVTCDSFCKCEFFVAGWHNLIPPNEYCIIEKETL